MPFASTNVDPPTMFGNLQQPDRNQRARQLVSDRYRATKATTTNLTSNLWNDSEIQKTVESLDPEQRHAYSRVGEVLFSENRKDPTTALFEAAAQIQTMIRDGIDPKSLTPEEIKTLVSVIGPDRAKELYDLNLSFPSENVYQTSECISVDTAENKGTKKRTKRYKKP